MPQRNSRYGLYRDFVDAYMKSHHQMTRCESHHGAQTEWNKIKTDDNVVEEKIVEYLAQWNKAGRPELPPKKSLKQKGSTPKRTPEKRTFSSDDDTQNDDPNIIKLVTPISSTRKTSKRIIELDDESSTEETTPKRKTLTPDKSDTEKVKTPAQISVLKTLNEISQRIDNLIQVKCMGLLTKENEKTLKKLLKQKEQQTNDLKRLQARQRASIRYRERQKQVVEKLCVAHPAVATELMKAFRPSTARIQTEVDCPDLLQIISDVACVAGVNENNNNNSKGEKSLSLDDVKDVIKQRGYEIHKSSLYYRLMPQRSLSQDGKKHVVTVPVRLRRMQGIEPPPKHEDSHYTAATLKHIKDLAGIFGNDCVFYLTQDTKAKITIGRQSEKNQSPLIMHLDYQISSNESQLTPIISNHQLTPCVYAASIIDETGLTTHTGPTYVSIRSAKHDRLTHESHAIDFDRLIHLKEFEKVAYDDHGHIKPIVIMNIDSLQSENNTRYSKTLASAINKFKKYDLDALIIFNQAPGQTLYNVVERRLSPMTHDLSGLILPYNNFGTHLNENGLTKHVELEKENFKLTGEVLAEVWNMNILDDYPVVAEYIKPSGLIDEQLKTIDSTLTLDSIVNQICTGEEGSIDQRVNQISLTSTIPSIEIKTECDIDEYWCAAHVIQTQYTIQIIRCNDPSCCTPWRSNYIQIFPHRFLPPPVPFHRSSKGVKMAEIESSSALTNPISPFYGNLFQRIQFHGIIVNRTRNDLLPFDAYCPSLQTKLLSYTCSICKQYIPTSTRLHNHYKIHQQYSSDTMDYHNKEEHIIDEDNFNDPYDMPMSSTEKSVYLFTNIMDWLKSDFEEDPIIDQKIKSTAATASAMIRQNKQINTETTIISNEQQITTTTSETTCLNDNQTGNVNVLDALEHLAVIDNDNNPQDNIASWDDLQDLINAI